MFEAISDYWSEEDEEYPEDEEPNSNVAGALIGGFKIAKNLINNRNQKNSESREALLQGIIAQKKAEAEALRKKAEIDAKNKRIKTISIVSVLGLIAVITAVVYIKKQKNG
jgi:Na+/glutamate symporter